MTFGTPWMLLLLLMLPLIAALMLRCRRRQRRAACQLQGVAPADAGAKLQRSDWLIIAALLCIILALARPQWNPQPYEVQRRGRDVVFVLDVSRSMLAADLFPNRLEMARIAIQEALPTFHGQRVALITFAGSASVPVPLTLDHEFVRYMLQKVSPNEVETGSTSLQVAVDKVTGTVLADATGGARDVILFTDGEDHLSDVKKTATQLAQCDARVLIIGLGDPVSGARVPHPFDENEWMQHNDQDVISRLQEDMLTGLAGSGPHVTYYPARTHPFDLVPLYEQLIAGTTNDAIVGGQQRVRYSEGYPFLLSLAILLCLAASLPRLPGRASAALLIMVVVTFSGCRPVKDEGDAAYQARFKKGLTLLTFAQEQTNADVFAEKSLLLDAREEFLRAALLLPGDEKAARQITSATRRLHELESLIEQKQAKESQRREKLTDTITRLEKLAALQEQICERSREIMRRRPPPSEANYNLPDAEREEYPPPDEANRLAPPFATDQQTVRTGTANVLSGVKLQQDTLRGILQRAYGNPKNLPATEIDPVVAMLGKAVSQQDEALAQLTPGEVHFAQANTAFHTAAGQMRQALDAMRSLLPPVPEQDEEKPPSRNPGDLENVEGDDAESREAQAQPITPGDFQEALSRRSLPIPNYTSAEILAEEAANQQQRSRRKAAKAGSKVEKNW